MADMNFFTRVNRAFPPKKPHFTETDVADLTGKVYIVSGANTGIGKELARILYSKNATVWVAARNEEKARAAIADIETSPSAGKLKYMKLDLADLSTVAASAKKFLAEEKRLDVLFNNAGVMNPPDGNTPQGYELQLGTNCLGPHLFTKTLTPILKTTAATSPAGSVRVIWVSSMAAEVFAPHGGVELDNLDYKRKHDTYHKYGVSKAGNYFQGTEFARRHKTDGIVSIPLNPGNLHTELDRSTGWWLFTFRKFTCYPPIYGAYTELFAAFSPSISLENTGTWVEPWGRILPMKKDVEAGSKPESEGGTGTAEKFWDWADQQVKQYE